MLWARRSRPRAGTGAVAAVEQNNAGKMNSARFEMKLTACIALVVISGATLPVAAGPYSGALGDSLNAYDPPIPGWVGPAGDGYADVPDWYPHPGNYVNPAFLGWATGYRDYLAADFVDPGFDDPSLALGPVTGFEFDTVSLGDMGAGRIAAHLAAPDDPNIVHPGRITLTFQFPIRNGDGADFAVFENGFARVASADFFAELAHVEVSSDGVHFARFDSRSLTTEPNPQFHTYLTINATDLYNLAGKHTNAQGISWGTPFDLQELTTDPLAIAGDLDLTEIRYVRVVDIPGSGDFLDDADPQDPIYDAWVTVESGGFDLDAVGALHVKVPGDANLDDEVGIFDLGILADCYGMTSGADWGMADFNGDGAVNILDLGMMADNYGFGRDSSPPTPEPATAALLLAAGAMALRRRRRID